MADEPVSSDPQPPAGEAPTAPATPAAPAAPNPATTAWNALDRTSRMIVGASLATVVILLLGALVDAWDSTDFLLIVLVAALAAGGAAWYTSTTNASPKPSPLPLATIEFAGGLVASVLAALNVLELLFDLDQLSDFGGPIGVLLTVLLVVSSIAILVGAERRDPSLRSPRRYGDTGTRLALSGFALVIIGWAMNLTVSYWTMRAGALPIAMLTLAAVVIIVAPKWTGVLPGIPLAFVGAAFGVVGLIIAIGQWGDLMELGSTQIELGILDLVGFLLYLIGIVLVIAGGVLAGIAAMPKRAPAPAADAEPSSGTPGTPDAPAAPDVPAAPATPAAAPAADDAATLDPD